MATQASLELPKGVEGRTRAYDDGDWYLGEVHSAPGAWRAYTGRCPATRSLRVTAVIPALNEAENLSCILPRVAEWVDEVILVDGHSTDATVARARALYPPVRIVTQPGRGKGDALRCGIEAATGDMVVTLDADGSTDPREIPGFIGVLAAGADFAKGSRFVQGAGTADMPLLRRAGNAGLVLLARVLFGGAYTDLCYGYNAFWRDIGLLLHPDADGFEIETLLNVRALKAHLKVVEVPSFEAPRHAGVGRLRTFPDGWRVLKTLVRERLLVAGGV
jgi:glycosyltransferase involved in cell wall biosynthesis